MGVPAGNARATTIPAGDHWITILTARSADWLEGLYPLDDRVEAEWGAAHGSVSYATHFREGGFQQDTLTTFLSTGIEISRRSLVRGVWTPEPRTLPPHPDVDDPLSAVMRLRALDPAIPHDLTVFSGSRVVPIHAEPAGIEAIGSTEVQRVDLRTVREGVMEDKLTAWFSVDGLRIPVKAVVHTRAGPVEVRQVSGVAGSGAPPLPPAGR